MTRNVSDRNGRALEYIVAIELQKLNGFRLTNQSERLNCRDREKFDSLPVTLQQLYQDASLNISRWVESLFPPGSNVIVDRPNDNPGNPSDFILKSNNQTLLISLKHNHQALKHPRPYSLAQACGYSKSSWQDENHRNRLHLVSDTFRASNTGKQLFNQCSRPSIDKLYFDVCTSCEDSVRKWMISDVHLAKNLFDFFVSKGFYKVIVDTKDGSNVKVQDYLSVPQPNTLITTVKRNRLILIFDNNWTLDLRIHTASRKISEAPSQLALKFDVQKEKGEVTEFSI